MFDIVPAVDLASGRVVRLTEGDPNRATVYGDNPLVMARRWVEEGARRLHLVDLDAAWGKPSSAPALLPGLRNLGIAVQIGGGIRDVKAAQARLTAGATDVIVGSLLTNARGLAEMIAAVGADRMIAAVDVKAGHLQVSGWKRSALIAPEDAADQAYALGIRRFIVTAVDRDGTERGPDLDLMRQFARPEWTVWASGGIGNVEDLKALAKAGVYGAIVGRALYEGRFTFQEAQAAVLC